MTAPTVHSALAGVLLGVVAWQAVSLLLPDRGPAAPILGLPAAAGTAGDAATEIEVRIDDGGALHVVETVTFPQPQTRLFLAVPRRSGAGETFAPTLSGVRVDDGTAHPAQPMGPGEQQPVQLTAPTSRVVLEYDATGATIGSGAGSDRGRSLALVTPLVTTPGMSLPTTVHVRSVKVRGVACLRSGELTACGTRTDDGWTVESSGGRDGTRPDVVASLDLAGS
jgi:hypothetical protein